MVRFVNEQKVIDLYQGSGVTLVGTQTALSANVRWFGAGAGYSRPRRVEVGGGDPIRITDHVMTVRLATAVLLLLATLWRVLR